MDNILEVYLLPFLIIAAKSVFLVTSLLITIAFLLLADRKIWAAVQMRRGPNVVGAFGLLQSFADLLKFVFKEVIIPTNSDKFVFLLAPFVTTVFAISAWAVIPFDAGLVLADINGWLGLKL
jgi:NADH-quinone oxidoreductase subunit H